MAQATLDGNSSAAPETGSPIPENRIGSETLFDMEPTASYSGDEDADIVVVNEYEPSVGTSVRKIYKIFPNGERELLGTSTTSYSN
jgi:hypothetical protein